MLIRTIGALGLAAVTAAAVAAPAAASPSPDGQGRPLPSSPSTAPGTAGEGPSAQRTCPGSASPTRSDFNGDGHADAAVGDPFAAVGGTNDAGAVTVLYGGGDGRVGEGERARITQDSPGVPGGVEGGDWFGAALEPVNLDGDGCTDLVVGTHGEDLDGAENAGAVVVLYGSPDGLGAGRGSLWIDQSTAKVPGSSERLDEFGYSLSAAPAEGADAATLVVGTPYEDIGSLQDAGAATALWFTEEGGIAAAARFDQDTPGVPGRPETSDLFGLGVELARVSGSTGRWDLLVGVPYEDVGSVRNSGGLIRIGDIAEAAAEYPSAWWDQASPGVAGSVEAGDLFGTDPEYVPTPEGGYAAVGVPGEDLSGRHDGGMAQSFTGTGDGLRADRSFHQDKEGAAGAVEDNDYFGFVLDGVPGTVAGGDARVVFGLPYEDIGAEEDSGAAQSFSLDAAGYDDRWIDQSTAGVPGTPEAGDFFGQEVATAGDEDEQALLVGAPDENAHGTVTVLPFGGGARAWEPGAGGVPEPANRFGASLAGHA
ncbi:FG-GAP-like repeat-containing protein [Nocardiopsis sp. RSe5-2]|uniref:FG-GAP-like repeat-containing protein n=1 Tax=Nocardiopsis endophytica TaxID=3018445 RepID=A0ABT4TZT0_9ACTN|nr:FG-GAP-like repeat-containing protein [Nocardiopsis endophytica]MDA2810208.1 FG-GAP-like repeat-containing protein [Nocardiopsis endophytica]